MKRLFERVMNTMIKAGWLHRFTFTDGKGFRLTWTKDGALASITLKQWNQALRFTETDDCAGITDKLLRGFAFDGDRSQFEMGLLFGRLKAAGFALSGSFSEGSVPNISWTAAGLNFRDTFIRLIDETGLSTDYDGLMALFHIADGWAPDGDSPVVRS